MGIVRVHVGDRVKSLCWGEGTIKEIHKEMGIFVEFDRHMGGHSCNDTCKKGHGWVCMLASESRCRAMPRIGGLVYFIGTKEWD